MPVTYRTAGVNIKAADAWLDGMKPLIRSTSRAEVLADRGQFAGLFRLAKTRYRDPVLVSSTDGVGTKLKVAQLLAPMRESDARRQERVARSDRRMNAHVAIGIDCVAMNVNDVIAYGAEPLFFLDYLAVGRIQPALLSRLLRGVVNGCRQSGAALLGGETAEMPGVYADGEYDIAGFCVAVAERSALIDGAAARAGDRIIGLASSGVHSNGFSLVRKVFTEAELTRYGPQLMKPTRIYVKPVLAAVRRFPVRAITHVTGGGISRRIPSLVSNARGLAARLAPGSWTVPKIFRAIQAAGAVSDDEMARTFNMGIGMALVCRPQDAKPLIKLMQEAGVAARSIGSIERS